MIDPATVLTVLDRLDAASVPVWVEGGWGIDALVGVQTRPHDDLDLALDRDRLDDARSALLALALRHDETAAPGLPARLVLRDGAGTQVDVHPLVFDADGNGRQPLGDGAWGCYPADGLTGVGVIGGRQIRCLTPELQLRHHLGYPPDADDRHDLRLLARHFGLSLPPDV